MQMLQQRQPQQQTNKWAGECVRCHERVGEGGGYKFYAPLRLVCFACALREDVKDDNGFRLRLASFPRTTTDGKQLALYPFQVEDCKRISTTRSLLIGSAPGTGKTAQAACAALRIDAPNFVFVPTSVRENWLDEIGRWRPELGLVTITGRADFARNFDAHLTQPGQVLIGSYGTLPGSPCSGCRTLKVRLRELKKWKEEVCALCDFKDGKEVLQKTPKGGGKCLQCGMKTARIEKPRFRGPLPPPCNHAEDNHPPTIDLKIDGQQLRLAYHPKKLSIEQWLKDAVPLPPKGPAPPPDVYAPSSVACAGCRQTNPLKAIDRPCVLVVDECHAFKQPNNERTRNFRAFRNAIWNAGGYVFGLSGTPCEGKPIEFWEVLVSLGLEKAAFGREGWQTYEAIFKDWFSNPKGSRQPPSGLQHDELRRRLNKIQVRRLRKDVLSQLPPRQEMVIHVDLTDRTIHEVDESVHRMLAVKRAWEDVQARRVHLGAVLMSPFEPGLEPDERQRRRLVYDSRVEYYFKERPKHTDQDVREAVEQALTSKGQMPTIEELSRIRAMLSKAKIGAVEEWIKNREEEDEPVVLFSQHVSILKKIAGEAVSSGRPGWACFHGGLTAKQRAAIVKSFQSGEIERGLAVSIGAGGEGITLTRAAVCGFVDLAWNPAKNSQCESRLIRIGAERHDEVAAVRARKRVLEGNLSECPANSPPCRIDPDTNEVVPCANHQSRILVVRFIAKHVVDELVIKTLVEKEALLAALEWEEHEVQDVAQ